MRKLFAGNGNPPPKDKPNRQAPAKMPDDGVEHTQDDAGNGNPPPVDNP